MELSNRTVRKIKELILFAVITIACFWKYDVVLNVLSFVVNVLFPFILGGAIAFVFNVPMNFFQRHLFKSEKIKNNPKLMKLEKPVCLVIVLASVIGALVLVMTVVIPQLSETFMSLGRSIQDFFPTVQTWAREMFQGNKDILVIINRMEFDWNKVVNFFMNFFQKGAGNVVDTTIIAAKSIVSALTTFFIAFVFAVYILLQKEKLNVQTRKVMFAFMKKGRAEAALEICSLTYSTFSSFLTGQCTEAIILGSMFVVVMTVLNLPYALLIGILIAFTALIPMFGAFIGCAVGAFLIFMVDPIKALIFVVVFLVLQQIEGNFIYPYVVGNSVGLPSIWVLAAVSIGGSLMGVVGMLIFIPLVSVFYALFREIVYLKLKQNNIKVEDIIKK